MKFYKVLSGIFICLSACFLVSCETRGENEKRDKGYKILADYVNIQKYEDDKMICRIVTSSSTSKVMSISCIKVEK